MRITSAPSRVHRTTNPGSTAQAASQSWRAASARTGAVYVEGERAAASASALNAIQRTARPGTVASMRR